MEIQNKLLSAILENPEYLESLEFLKPKYFAGTPKIIFQIIQQFYSEGKPISLVTIGQEMLKLGIQPDYLTRLTEIITQKHAEYLGKLLVENYFRRLLRNKFQQSMEELEKSDDIFDYIEKFQQSIDSELNEIEQLGDEKPFSKLIIPIYEELLNPSEDKREGLRLTYLPTMDDIIQGILPGDLIGIYGTDKSTKTTLAQTMIRDIVEQGYPALIYSYEWSVKQTILKLISLQLGIDLKRLRNPVLLSEEEKAELKKELKYFEKYQLFIEDEPLNESQIYQKTKRMIRKNKIKIVMIDYLMLIPYSRKYNNLRERLNELSRFFKLMAQKLKIPIILISQANMEGTRAAEGLGLHRDSDYYFSVIKVKKKFIQVGKNQIEKLSPEKAIIGDIEYNCKEGDIIVTNEGMRYGEGGRRFVMRFVNNQYVEIDVRSK